MEEHAGNYVHSGLHRQKRLRFFVDNIDGQTAMSVYQRQPTMDDRAYLTKAQHPDSYLPPTITIDGVAVVHELNVHKINSH